MVILIFFPAILFIIYSVYALSGDIITRQKKIEQQRRMWKEKNRP